MKLASRSRSRLRTRRRGAAIVEAALVLPIIITFLFGIMEYGRYLMTLQIYTNAARQGARYALAHTQPVQLDGTYYGNATSDVIQAVTHALAGQRLAGQQIDVFACDAMGNHVGSWNNAASGQLVCVRIRGNYPVLLGRMLALNSSIPVVAQAAMRSEGN